MTNRIEIEIDEDGEHADVLVCLRLTSPLTMADNQIGVCSQCGAEIQFRPYVPKSPRKMCMECVEPLANAAKGKLTSIITPQTVAELRAYFHKKNAN